MTEGGASATEELRVCPTKTPEKPLKKMDVSEETMREAKKKMDTTEEYKPEMAIFDGCTAAAHVAYANSDTSFIFPITPSTAMAEATDVWAHQGRLNIFGQVTRITQMQSEAGAAGAVHGSLIVGCLTTTFTASQGLLLMVPNMYKIAGELTPCVFHVSARAVAGQALSIFGDHSDVMAVRQCGWALLSSSNVQEAMDLAQIAHMTTLKARVPFVHFFDGFRISHELQKIKLLDNKTMHSLVDHEAIQRFRTQGLNPSTPTLVGTSQGPEIYFQNLEAANQYYDRVSSLVEEQMILFEQTTNRRYNLFRYDGHPDATDVIVIMGAGAVVCQEVISYILREEHLSKSPYKDIPQQPWKVGVITVHLFRPWSLEHFLAALPQTVTRIAVLDRTKESGALGEPLYLDIAASLQIGGRLNINVIGGRYGLGSKDFTSSMVLAVFDNLRSSSPKRRFTVGIQDDLTHLSLDFKVYRSISTVPMGTKQCMFWGFGSDGTVSANKNVIKIIGDNTSLNIQGYFAYSAHKAGGVTVSHLRFGAAPITSQYLIQEADYVACHRDAYITTFNMTRYLKQGAVFVLNCPWSDEELDVQLPAQIRHEIAKKEAKFYTIDANAVAQKTKMGRRINNILMTLFFRLSGVLPFEEAIQLFKSVIAKTYAKKGKPVIEANWNAVDAALDLCHQVPYDKVKWLYCRDEPVAVSVGKVVPTRKLDNAPEFIKSVLLPLEKLEGENLPTSAFEPFVGGRLPMGISAYEKRGIALQVPIVDMELCTQCNYCSFVCPHAAIRPFLIDDDEAETTPESFIMKKAKGAAEIAPYKYRIQVSPLDCTGCELCSIACPAKCLEMTPLDQVRSRETEHWNYAISLPCREDLCEDTRTTIKGSQFYQPLMEFSGACEGCGETPYVKLLTQLFGERMIIANATGCSSIWGASYPSNPYTTNKKGYGPAWGNSLFEDNAEYGYGMVVALQQRRERFHDVITKFIQLLDDNEQKYQSTMDQTSGQDVQDKASSEQKDGDLSASLLKKSDIDAELYDGLVKYRDLWLTDASLCTSLYEELEDSLNKVRHLHPSLDFIVQERQMFPKFSHWIIGGDGWAYDIGYGGLDHVVASGIDINILILDTEVYSNTGGQKSKATPIGAVHKFSAGGNLKNKKDLGMLCMQYGNIYVASVSSSANMTQTIRTFVEAERYKGPSVILAYAPCIEHGYIKPFSAQQVHCTMAVETGYWPLYRYNPELETQGLPPLQLDSKKIKGDVCEMLERENRFEQLNRTNPKVAELAHKSVRDWVLRRFNYLRSLSDGTMTAIMSSDTKGGSQGKTPVNDEHMIHILYGSETGNAEDVATRIGGLVSVRGDYKAKVVDMNELDIDDLVEFKHVLIIISTAGQGELPANAKSFYEELSKPDYLKEDSDGKKLLSSIDYSVFGLGDSSYIFFNEAAKKFDKKFEELGAKRILACGLGDDQEEEKYDTALSEWLPSYWKEADIPEPLNESDEPAPSLYKVDIVQKKEFAYKQCLPHGASFIRLCVNRLMTPKDYSVEIRHLEFDLSATKLRYGLGDSLAIYPQTDPELVTKFCSHFQFDPNTVIHITRAREESSKKHEALFKHPMTVRQLLTECLDIAAKPNRRFYEILYKYCVDPEEKLQAKQILEDKSTLQKLTKEYTNIFDLLVKYKSIAEPGWFTLDRMIDLIPLHKPRYYSIASSQKFVGPDRLHLCIGIVDWMLASKQIRYGGCTGYIRRMGNGADENTSYQIACAIKSTAFNMPPNDTYPMIMAGMGTGLAPFRSFIQYRAYLKRSGKPCGPVVLYFGCRYSAKDFLYGDELKEYEKEGVITDLKVAFSRDQAEKFYVQHHIDRDTSLLYKRLITEKGFFYLCGSAKQVPIDIRAAVIGAICKEASVTPEEAEKMVTDMQIKGQYNVEAW